MLELFGYIASLIVLISFLMKDMIQLRIINTLACVMFVIYGYLHETLPVVMTNLIVIAINSYYIIKYYVPKVKIKVVVEPAEKFQGVKIKVNGSSFLYRDKTISLKQLLVFVPEAASLGTNYKFNAFYSIPKKDSGGNPDKFFMDESSEIDIKDNIEFYVTVKSPNFV